jgi:hypothetical protein
MTAMRAMAEMVTVEREAAERMSAGRVVENGEEEKAELFRKLALSSVGGNG